MCGRFAIDVTWSELHDAVRLIPVSAVGRNDPPRYNVAPTQDVGFVTLQDGETTVMNGRWWLALHSAKEIPQYPMFNARAETAHEKSSFRDAMKTRRCLIPATGYYEWTIGEDGGKDPHFIHLPDKEPFMFAGLWAHNAHLDITSCTILTAPASPEIGHLHHRMPIILKPDAHQAWVEPDIGVMGARALYNENMGHQSVSYRVGREVNSSKRERSELIEPC